MFIGTKIISFNNSLYQLIRRFRDVEGAPISDMKEYYNCDTVLRKEGYIYFCRHIQEPQLIQETDGKVQLVETPQQETITESGESVEGEIPTPAED